MSRFLCPWLVCLFSLRLLVSGNAFELVLSLTEMKTIRMGKFIPKEVMEPPKKLRPYQAEAARLARASNLIVHLPTGQGKTLIACSLIDQFLMEHPRLKIFFAVPTRPLVSQQARVIREDCQTPELFVKELATDESWLDESLQQHHVFVGTYEQFRLLLVPVCLFFRRTAVMYMFWVGTPFCASRIFEPLGF